MRLDSQSAGTEEVVHGTMQPKVPTKRSSGKVLTRPKAKRNASCVLLWPSKEVANALAKRIQTQKRSKRIGATTDNVPDAMYLTRKENEAFAFRPCMPLIRGGVETYKGSPRRKTPRRQH